MAIIRNQQELAFAVMEDLGLIGPGQSPAARDRESIVRRYQNLLEELRDENTVYWEYDEIPYEVFEAVVNVVGLMVMKSFGLPGPTAGDMDDALEAAKRRIRKRVVKPASGETVAADDSYF
jgi:hypothetical protein